MPVAGATKRNLPVELYRSIAESLVKEGDRRFEFKPASYASVKLLLTVSKSFQVEAERLIWRVVCLESHHDGDIILLCDHILSIPRVWPYIKCFRLVNRDRFQYGIKAKFGINPPHPQTVDFLASLLRKLANLVFLEMTLGLWKSGSLLKNMPFRLRIFLLDCALDDDMLLFLNQQPSITEWRVDFEESQLADLPTTTLPNLAVINIPFGNETVVKGRPITHVYARTAASLRTLTLSTMPLKTLVVDFVVNTPILETITELFPALESFSPLDCTAANVSDISLVGIHSSNAMINTNRKHLFSHHLSQNSFNSTLL
jgi:hypothetical protein